MTRNTTKSRRRAAGLCPTCGDDPGDFVSCEPCRKRERGRVRERGASHAAWAAENRETVNARHRAWYAARVAKGCCGKCANRLRPDGRCGVCEYLRRVAARGGVLQGVRDGSCVG